MADSSLRADPLNVEQIMEQIRARIREKRGVDSAEREIQEQATATLAAFLDPAAAHADLIDQLRKVQPAYEAPQLPAYEFEDSTLYESTRGLLTAIRRLLNPILKLFFNPNPLIRALNVQSKVNAINAEREAKREAMRLVSEQRQYELLHNLMVEMTRTTIETKNLRMRVESVASRLEFNERRTRGLESAMPHRAGDAAAAAAERPSRGPAPTPAPPPQGPQPAPQPASTMPGTAPGQPGEGQRSRRRRRRRGRRGGGTGAPGPGPVANQPPSSSVDSSAEMVRREDLETFGGAASHPTEAEPAGEREESAAASAPPPPTDPEHQ
jgi:hypothetical protein